MTPDAAAAARAGVTLTEYRDRVNAGLLWCYRDQAWEPAEQFGRDRSRIGGRAGSCRRSVNAARARQRRAFGSPDEDPSLTLDERRSIAALQRVANTWPRSLTLASMGGDLVIVRTGDPRFDGDGALDRAEAVVADISGIPNTGGDW